MEQDNDNLNKPDDPEVQTRREFLKKVGKAGATAPAVALLMAANFKTGNAIASTYDGGGGSGSGGS